MGAAWSALCAGGKSSKCHIKSWLTWILLSAVFNTVWKTRLNYIQGPIWISFIRFWMFCYILSHILFCSFLKNLNKRIRQAGWLCWLDCNLIGKGSTNTAFTLLCFSLPHPGREGSYFASLPTRLSFKLNWGMQNRATESWFSPATVSESPPFYSKLSHMEKEEGKSKKGKKQGQEDREPDEIEHREQGSQPHKPAAAMLNPHCGLT